jgi:hypothetical protein
MQIIQQRSPLPNTQLDCKTRIETLPPFGIKQAKQMDTREIKRLVDIGLRTADSEMADEDVIWSLNSNDKVDIGERLACVIRTLHKANPLTKKIRALSLGSSSEPQFRILETAFKGGLYLMDIDQHALDIVMERVQRQYTGHVSTLRGNYLDFVCKPDYPGDLLATWLQGKKLDLITLHHSLYYCPEPSWLALYEALYRNLLSPRSAIHAVLMADRSTSMHTTTWLYNYFAGKFFGIKNNQSLPDLKKKLERSVLLKDSQLIIKTSHVKFFVNDFARFMKVIWMLLLYPDIHPYNDAQKEEIIRFMLDNFWLKKQPLLQKQHHLVLYRGLDFKGIL